MTFVGGVGNRTAVKLNAATNEIIATQIPTVSPA